MSLADRLRGVIGPAPGASGANPSGSHREPERLAPHDALDAIVEVLGGEWREANGHRYMVIDTRYGPGHVLGRVAVSDCLPPADGVWPRLPLLAGPPGAAGAEAPALQDQVSEVGGRLLFVDLETTGLAGGAGSYAFLVGCGWFEPPLPSASALATVGSHRDPTGQHWPVGPRTRTDQADRSAGQGACFRVRQFFLASYAAERAVLEAVADTADAASGVVTYNGKTFDLPLLETRFLLHRMATPFAGKPHVDMLHPVRRLWSAPRPRSDRPPRLDGRPDFSGAFGERVPACRLTNIEETLLGHVREDDVAGFEIPSRYFHYVRTSDARPLRAVLEHNRMDLLGLAMLTARAAQLLDEGAAAARSAREALGLGRLFERGGLAAEARACYQRAADMDSADSTTRAEALRACAILHRRDRRYADAAAAWRRVLGGRGCPAHLAREATEALAVHHEHRERDLPEARRLARQALQFETSMARTQAVEYRLARLERKLGEPGR
ncbi:MAG: ribonuclease H-like domain-containing protein [Acidobacteria bacterium]|nr:ribonuclease H-like domain-containing protein [Acidobacteriota bacterium]